MIKTLTCAIVAAAAVALSASTSHAAPIGFVTNFDVITFNLTIRGSTVRATGFSNGGTNFTQTIVSQKFVTKNLLALLSSSDFANQNFTNGAQVAMAWDFSQFESHLVVIDKFGNVYYDITANNTSNAMVTLDLAFLLGAESGTARLGNPGGENITAFNTGYFNILDRPDGTNDLYDLYGYGPSTRNYTINWNASGPKTNLVSTTTSWSSRFTFTPQSADQTFNGANFLTTTGTITTSGRGKTTPYSLNNGSLGQQQ